MRAQFAQSNLKRVSARSQIRCEEFNLTLTWTTPEYIKYLEGAERRKQIEDLSWQIDTLNSQKEQLIKERDKFEDAVAKPYEMSLTTGADRL